jgi:hypothetical protein
MTTAMELTRRTSTERTHTESTEASSYISRLCTTFWRRGERRASLRQGSEWRESLSGDSTLADSSSLSCSNSKRL